MLNDFLANIPECSDEEIIDVMVQTPSMRIERIISYGHSSPIGFWYDQDEHEFVTVLKGHAELTFEDGEKVALKTGQGCMIQAHKKHRVSFTASPTIWLAVFTPNNN